MPKLVLPTDCPLQQGVNLAPLTSYRVGGPAQWYVAPSRWEDLQSYYRWAQEEGLPITLLGAGSNLLISDRGLNGLVIASRHLQGVEFDASTGRVSAGAGKAIAALAWAAAKRGWEGLQWAVGIPGTVGGAVVMNAGAHRACVADCLVSAVVLWPTGEIEELTAKDFDYSYRSSNLQGGNRSILRATFQLQPGAEPARVMAATQQNLEQRKRSQPYHLPSCGSVFRNPQPQAAGWLIEQLGLKGYQIGNARVAHRHANFILNLGGATAADIFHLIAHVQEQVEQHWQITLQPEVKFLGRF